MSLVARIASLSLFAAVVGTLSSLAAIAFVRLVRVINDVLLISPRSRVMAGDSFFVNTATVLVPAIGGLLVGLLWYAIKERRPIGPADAILSVQTLDGRLSGRSGFLSTVGSIVSLGCGASVGQYGPLVLMGSVIGSRLGIAASKNMGIVGVGCGAAAAIATAFNAPIAGLVFAHEVILRHYSIRAFAPVTIAATIGYVLANVVFDQQPLFHINPVALKHPAEYIGFVAIGIAGSLLAIAFMRAVLASGKLAAGLPMPSCFKPMLAGLLLGLVALWQPELLGVGSELLRFATIDNAFEANELAVLITGKVLVTALCIGFGFAGGVFSPALLIGALFGALAGSGAELILGDDRSAVALYAICGMVSVTSPIIGAPLTTILIVFELTRNYDLAMACMVSVVFANLIGYRLFGRSLFDVQLATRGVDLSLGRDKAILDRLELSNYLTRDNAPLVSSTPLDDVWKELLQSGRTEINIVDTTSRYIGTVSIVEFAKRKEEGETDAEVAGDLARPKALVLDVKTSVWDAMNQLGDFVGEYIPVVDKDDNNRLVGEIIEAALVKAYLSTVQNVREEEHAQG